MRAVCIDVVMNEEISMCGFGPTVAMLTAVGRLGAISTDLVRYATSGDISGDRERVVGYAGILVSSFGPLGNPKTFNREGRKEIPQGLST